MGLVKSSTSLSLTARSLTLRNGFLGSEDVLTWARFTKVQGSSLTVTKATTCSNYSFIDFTLRMIITILRLRSSGWTRPSVLLLNTSRCFEAGVNCLKRDVVELSRLQISPTPTTWLRLSFLLCFRVELILVKEFFFREAERYLHFHTPFINHLMLSLAFDTRVTILNLVKVAADIVQMMVFHSNKLIYE